MRDLALTVGGYPIQGPGDIKIFSLQKLVQWGIITLIVVSILLTLFFLVSGGIDMITSGGDKQKVVNSRHKLTYAVLGLVVVLLSFFIVRTLGELFGVDVFPTFAPNCIGKGSC